jgi:hypothetical protein
MPQEAVRAQHGQGFAVASEARRLAAMPSEAAQRTEQVMGGVLRGIEASRSSSERSVATVRQFSKQPSMARDRVAWRCGPAMTRRTRSSERRRRRICLSPKSRRIDATSTGMESSPRNAASGGIERRAKRARRKSQPPLPLSSAAERLAAAANLRLEARQPAADGTAAERSAVSERHAALSLLPGTQPA